MKKVKCKNGHFYDADRFDLCPVCGKQSSEVLVQRNLQPDPDATVKLPESTVLGDFVAEDQPDVRPEPSIVDEIAPSVWIAPGEALFTEADDKPVENAADKDEDATPGFCLKAPAVIEPMGDETAEQESADDEPAEGICEMPGGETPPKKNAAPAEAQPQFPLLAEAVTASDAAAVPVLPQRARTSDGSAAVLPVGWIVGLNGINRGKVFFCKAGRNHVGNRENMDIRLKDERSVNQDIHAIIIYEPKNRQFFVQVGIGDELPYLNGERVFTHEELHAYDRITLGEAEFLFLPLCGESFDWNENTHQRQREQ